MISVHTFICMFDVCVRCLVCWIDPADKNTVWYLMWWRQATERQRMFGVLIRMMQFLFGEIEPKTNKIIYKSICEHTFIFGCLLFAVAGEKIIYSIYANSRTLAKCQINIGPVWWFLYDMVPLWTFPPPNKHLRLLSAAFFFYFSNFMSVWFGLAAVIV